MAAQGRDIKLAKSRVEGYRNFATKLWNACRFAEMNGCATLPGFEPDDLTEVLNRWIAHETARTVDEVTAAIEAYKFNEAASAVYHFVWNIYCDWYISDRSRRARPRPAPRSPGRATRFSRCSIPSCRSLPRSCGRSPPKAASPARSS
jgi:valyl-tRNA synthetase